MTIKPIINQKSKDDGTEEQKQSGGIQSPNRDKRKGSVFEESGARHTRRTPQKSSNRMKRDHQKRLEVSSARVAETHNNSPYCPLGVNVVSATATTSLGHASTPNTLGSAVAQVAQSVDRLDEEALSGYNSGDEHRGRDAGLTELEWQQRDDEFVKLLAKDGLIVKEMEEDGACLFRAISLQIYGDQDMHEDIRQQTMDYISQNREYFAQFMTEDINGYISRKRNKNVHGNHIEIQAMSEIYNRPVELYCYQSKPINIFNSEQTNNGYEPLRLSYQRSSHYNAILDPYKASVGVGLGLAGYKPDELDLKQVQQAVRVSEELAIEQTMFEDKLKTTDWEATNEAIEEQIARESYLQWCRESLTRTKKSVSSTVTSQSMPGSSSGSSMVSSTVTSVVGGAGVAAVAECNNNSGVAPLISCDNPTANTSSMSPKQQQQYQSDDGLKSCSGSSTCPSVASSSSSGSSSLLGSELGGRQRRRRRTRHHHSSHANPIERGSDLPRASPPEMGGLNLLETRSTDSNDSDFSDETLSKKMKRRLGEEDEKEEEEEVVKGMVSGERSNVTERHINISVETEPGPSKSDPETSMNDKDNFYHSLLEASYIEDGSVQMTEAEMIQRAIQMSRIDYITKLQKNSDYDSP